MQGDTTQVDIGFITSAFERRSKYSMLQLDPSTSFKFLCKCWICVSSLVPILPYICIDADARSCCFHAKAGYAHGGTANGGLLTSYP